ncbi:DNA cytosine methyltransferase [Fusicatenibacter saccharivorans]|uniref:DNA cytosine methyltransferase n=1 Tax=Fusicatenibacter saccharivorans TaxID=1150298 RepID=UPI003F8A3AF4
MDKQNNLTLGSLFDGSGGFPLGGLLAGIMPVWSSEIEPFPVRVTTKRFPHMKHYGDISVLNGAKLPPVDIITFGSPCQDMSVAGKRSGLDGSRSSLFYEAIRIIKEMRGATDGKYPRYIVWENVPGAFSSNKGQDFRAVLEEVCKVKDAEVSVPFPGKWENAGRIMGNGYSVAWRQFDAQFWGVPQRRKRIYLVADFAGGSAGKILFESEGLSGYSAEGFRSWQTAAGASAEGFGETGSYSVDGYNSSVDEVAATLGVNCGVSTGRNGVMVLNDQGGNRMDVTEDITCTLRAESHHPPLVFENHSQDSRYTGPQDTVQTILSTFGTGGNNQPFVLETPKTLKIRSGCEGGGKGALIQDGLSATLGCNNDQTLFVPKAYGICSKGSNSMMSDNPHSGFYEADTSRCLDANGGDPSCNQGGIAVVAIEGNGSRPSHRGDGYKETDAMYTLNATEQHGVAYSSSKASFFTSAEKELANTLVATDYKDPPIVNDEDDADYIVRRLTPTECARLQGFPDWWCNDLATQEPTQADIDYWKEVFETHRKVMGTSSKPKSESQIIKWLKDPHSDSAEYKMWGNGVALPNVFFVLSGIVWASGLE